MSVENTTPSPPPAARTAAQDAEAATGPALPWRYEWAAVCGLVLLHLALGYSAVCTKSITYDELPHLTAGTAYWVHGDYRLHCENGNLPQRWCAAPGVLLGNAKLPPGSDPAWKTANVWVLGERFLHGGQNDFRQLLRQGRAAAALWGAALCVLVYSWSRSLFGVWGGLLSLACTALCPTLLANGPLMTSDACTAFFLLAAVGAVWRVLHCVSPLNAALAVAAVSGLFLAKFSAALIVPMALVMVVVRLRSGQELPLAGPQGTVLLRSRWSQGLAIAAVALLAGLGAWRAVWLAFGDRYIPPTAISEQYFKVGTLAAACRYSEPRPRALFSTLAALRALPEPYLVGGAFVLLHRERGSYFLGEYNRQGSPWFFPFCFAAKTPLGLLGLLGLGATALACARRPVWYAAAPLAALFVVYAGVSLTSTLNIGHRHLLPLYPALYVLAGAAAAPWVARHGRWAATACWVLLATETLAAWPNYLAYFNPAVQRDQAYRLLVDSSLDWGQDLPALADWLQRHRRSSAAGMEPVYLAYFGKGSPAKYGIDAVLLPRTLSEPPLAFPPGLYCVSATSLAAIYDRPAGRWNPQFERDYQAARAALAPAAAEPGAAAAASRVAAEARQKYDHLCYLRLLSYLRRQTPLHNICGSILVFRLTGDDLAAALDGPPLENDPLPWLERERRDRRPAPPPQPQERE